MKKLLFILCVALTACDLVYINEAEPVEPEAVTLTPNTTIAGLKAMYVKEGNPVYISTDVIIGGQVISSDKSGNLYRSLYIQDETGGIEIKIGRGSLYDDYPPGQWVYVRCKGLTIGSYGGMVQVGYYCENGGYETSYIDVPYMIAAHIYRGEKGEPVAPAVLTGSQASNPANFGRLVRFENTSYSKKVFVILYDDAKPNSNSTYLSDTGNYGITTWAMSQNGFKAYMTPNGVAEPQSAFGGAITKDVWQGYYNAAAAYSVSQYFRAGGADIQVRTNGYADFADHQIDSRILNGANANLTGILTWYNGNIQLVLNDEEDVEVIETPVQQP